METNERMDVTTVSLTRAPDGRNLQQREEDVPVSSLVQLAIEKGVDVDLLERLVALKERVDQRSARAAFFSALADFQDRCPQITKSRTAAIQTKAGGQYSYKYASLDDVARAIRPILKECGLSYSWDVTSNERTLIVQCTVRHIDGHSETSTFPVPIDTAAKMSDAQKNGAALTYGRRQSLVAALGITTADDDVDGKEPPTSADRITEAQAADLAALIEEIGGKEKTGRYTNQLCAWLKVEKLTDISAVDYQKAVNAIEEKSRSA